ncbi:NAD(P)/FAD-dependent oxidoreductase [Sporobolomyces koalae]|uniref:NAD(P)/FAD-dependent oxidoreductase n=1 Tax=Sporobolomyces koalae TaxID=500713 RepID=UPI00316E4A91
MSSNNTAAPLKNVVIVGLGLSGTHAFESLSKALPPTHRIVAVSPIPGYWPIAALRASVVPGFEHNTIAPLDHLLPAGSRHRILQGYSVSRLADNSIVLDKPHDEFGSEISFDYLVLATGSSYPFPCRVPNDSTETSIVEQFKHLQTAIAESKSILVLGGGPVGIEFAGEVAEYYRTSSGDKKKEITLVHSGERLIQDEGFKPKFGHSLQKQLEGLGVRVVLNEKLQVGERKTGKLQGQDQVFHYVNGQTVKADFLFVAFGNSPNTSFLPSTLLDPKTHRVLVKSTFETESNPRIYAIGDISSTDEPKLYANAKNHGAVVSQNIVDSIEREQKGGSSTGTTRAKKEYSPGQPLMVVSVGSKGGAGQLFGWIVGAWPVSFIKSKSLFVPGFKQLYQVK